MSLRSTLSSFMNAIGRFDNNSGGFITIYCLAVGNVGGRGKT